MAGRSQAFLSTTTGPIHSIVPITTPLTAGLLLHAPYREAFAKQSAYISFTLRNTKNGAVQYCTLNMN